MMNTPYHFTSVTLLITHYNRCKSLERLLKAFKKLDCNFGDIVISDDGSEKSQLQYIEKLQQEYTFRLITSPINKGLGNNINKGQDSVQTEYTLYIQEDFVPKATFPEHFADALQIMEQDKKWDMITLYSYSPYPYMTPYKLGFSEKVFHLSPWYTNNLKFYLYGDHPHLRKSTFLKDFGRYPEGLNGDQTEMQMSFAFIKNKGKCLLYDDHYGLLTQENSVEEPSTANFRKSWNNGNSVPFTIAKLIYSKYKFLKYNFQLLTKTVK
ncbi:glycosyltransferase [Pedobacter cryoconitis]|uniref:Glycosyl transferase family 2 n=1 Tax=Pedobacter cryoconitis TaxID=188932 RepID=A0A327S3K7_9SPHI|nr:glycosyltransferase [Pedobacter cryoconitis]RAJ22852.1 glycosyl transferase family 2 [Pedobacter cryoconitis]